MVAHCGRNPLRSWPDAMMKMIENNCRPASTVYFTSSSSARWHRSGHLNDRLEVLFNEPRWRNPWGGRASMTRACLD